MTKKVISLYYHNSFLQLYNSEYGRLMYIVHEKSTVDHKDLQNPKAHAWAYHPILSLENVESVFQAQNLRSVCPILHKFLQQVGLAHIMLQHHSTNFMICKNRSVY